MNHDDNSEYNVDPYKFYFQIDTEWLKKYMDNLFKNIDQFGGGLEDLFKTSSLPVNSWLSSIEEGSSSLYLGNNYWNEGIWKKKHFIKDKLATEYVKHLQSYAGYFLSQPKYYKGLYEILN